MSEWIVGRNPVFEVLRAGRRKLFELRLAREFSDEKILSAIQDLAHQQQIPVKQVPRPHLEKIGTGHQGVALKASPYPYADVDDILRKADALEEPLFVLFLDVLKDPQNLGTLIRTAEAVGVHGIVLPYRRTATVTPAVVSSSSGASEHLLIAQSNLAQTIALIKEGGAWVVGLAQGQGAQSPPDIDLSGPMGVVVGSEGAGMRRLVRESCDFLMEYPMRGKIQSLNAAVAGSLALYRIWEARDYRSGDSIDVCGET